MINDEEEWHFEEDEFPLIVDLDGKEPAVPPAALLDIPSTSTPTNSREHNKQKKVNKPQTDKKIYSQRLGRWVDVGCCLVCGESGHHFGSELCPAKADPNNERRRHWAGKVSCVQRATRFMKWILDRWEPERLSKTGVLDIAGGQGKLAYEFQLSPHRIPCIVIDPRAMIFSQKQKDHFDFQVHQNLYNSPPSWPLQRQILFEDNFMEDPENAKIWEAVSLLVGMHPDEATERIIEFGLKYKKSFAVLPCCVFPNKFPHRKTKDGRVVRYYEDFCDYLCNLDPYIQRDYLDIPGRNVILWRKFE